MNCILSLLFFSWVNSPNSFKHSLIEGKWKKWVLVPNSSLQGKSLIFTEPLVLHLSNEENNIVS